VATLHAKKKRSLFTVEGTLKLEPSFIPGADYKLKKILKKYGGWRSIIQESFVPTNKFYEELRLAGFSREYFDRSRAFINDPAAYTRTAVDKRQSELLGRIISEFPDDQDYKETL
jgi:hypothetical protein